MLIQSKLALAFGAICVLTCGTGALALLINHAVEADVAQISQGSVEKPRAANRMHEALLRIQLHWQDWASQSDATSAGGASGQRILKALAQEMAEFEHYLKKSGNIGERAVRLAVEEEEEDEIDAAQHDLTLLNEISGRFDEMRRVFERQTRPGPEQSGMPPVPVEKDQYDKLRAMVQIYEDSVVDHLNEEVMEVERALGRANQMVFWPTLVILMVSCLLAWFISRQFARPFNLLTTGARLIGEGRFDTTIAFDSKDEFGLLAQAFNRMSAALQTTTVSRNYVDGVLKSMPSSVIVTRADRTIQTVNPATLKMLGYTESELIGQPLEHVLHASAAGLRPIFDDAALEAQSDVELVYQTKSALSIPVSFSASLLRNAYGVTEGLVCVAQDISERKQVEEALQRQQTELRVLFDLVPAMIWFKDTHNGILRVNQRVATAAGRPIAAIEGKPTLEVYPEEAARFYADDLEVIRSGVPKLGYVESMLGELGEELWVETDKVPYRDKDGQVVGIVVMAQDITARKLAEQVLRESEELFRFLNDLAETTRTLADPAQIMAATSRLLGGHLHVSRCAYADVAADGEQFTILHDYTDGCASTVGQCQLSLFGPKAVSLLHGGQTLVIRNVMAELLPDEGADMFTAIGIQAIVCCPLVKKGTLRAMMAVHQTTPRDWRPGEVALVQDVVERCWAALERRTAEEDLRASKRFAESIAENSPNIIYLFDFETGKTIYTNRSAAESLGCSQAEILAMGDNLLPTIIHPEDLERVSRHVAQFAEVTDSRVIDLEYRLRHVDGSTRWVWTHDTVFNRRPNGDAWQIMGTAQDITSRKLAEAELAKTHRELLETSRLAGMAEVATGVLHNVGNVLNSVNIASSCLADSLRQSKVANLSKVVALMHEHAGDLGAYLSSDPKGRQLPGYLGQLAGHLVAEQTTALQELAQLQKNIEHIKDIVNMQQGFAKVSGLMEALQAADLVEDALHMNASSFTRHDITVIREFAIVPPVTVEKHKVLQILVNLLRNAKHACDDSGRADKRLTLRLSSDAAHLRIAVIDNGVGIPPDNLTRVFEHGFTTKKSGHGFGLHSGALAAREMGGTLTVHSAGPGCGATFTLELPLPGTGELTSPT